MAEKLRRQTFMTSRALEFFTEKELSMQIGHARLKWPLAILKELIDNSLDACEMAGILPDIEVVVSDDWFSVRDNGPGLPVKTLSDSLNYMVRVSDKNHYVSPTRGQLGNALKCVWAMPFVMDDEHGRVEVETSGEKHIIDVLVDRIAQEPKLEHVIEGSLVKNGTLVKINMDRIASYLENLEDSFFYQIPSLWHMVAGYTAMNPHVSFSCYCGATVIESPRRISTILKWTASNPTSIHWYDAYRFSDLIGAYLSHAREGRKPCTVRDFVGEFKGLSSTQKRRAVTESSGLAGVYLEDLISDNIVDMKSVSALLDAMKTNCKPVKPKTLGSIGQDHLQGWMSERFQIGSSFLYKRITGDSKGLPFSLEVAFGVLGDEMAEHEANTITGLNWSPTISQPFRNLDDYLSDARVEWSDPIALFVHLACPVLNFTDRGKTRLNLEPEIEDALQAAIKYVTKSWTIIKKRGARNDRKLEQLREKIRNEEKRWQWSIKEAAFEVMEEAYMKASDNNCLPANARQIMYAARPGVIELAGKCWKNSSYFTQTLLPEFKEQYPELTDKWDIIYDARGSLFEPHTHLKIEMGTLEVRQYINGWNDDGVQSEVTASVSPIIHTHGPTNRYQNVLYCEKEGFNALFRSVRLAEKYDMAIVSNKGMTVTAMRKLASELSAKGVNIFVLHDFDKAGFSIVNTLRTDTRRWSYDKAPNIIDLGFRLEDVIGLETEQVFYDSKVDPRENLIQSGATIEEAQFLRSGGTSRRWSGCRVELNAMTSRALVKWIESKLESHGVQKMVPNEEVLKKAFISASKAAKIDAEVRRITNAFYEEIKVPDELEHQIRTLISGSSMAWDDAIRRIATDRAA